MSSFGQTPPKDVFVMLDACAPGHVKVETLHHWCIQFNNKTFPSLPKGAHGKANPPIQHGVIKKMARHLGFLECCRQLLGC